MTMAERPSDKAIAQAVHEQQERGYYTGACDCILTRAGEIDALRINTHAADCYLWGVKHHECAVREIERLRTLTAAPSEPMAVGHDDFWTCPLPSHWRRAISDIFGQDMVASIEQRAREIAREGK